MRDAAHSVAPVGAGPPVQRRPLPPTSGAPLPGFLPLGIQRSALPVSSPSDPAEREADSIADRVVSGAGASPAPASVSRAPAPGPLRASTPTAAAAVPASGGEPLPQALRKEMERSLGADLSGVRVHTDSRANDLARKYSAIAFATGSHVFFSRGSFQPQTPEGRKLLAHELVHTIQQGASPREPSRSGPAGAPVVSRTASGRVQRLGIQDALDFFADKANYLPGFRLFTIAIGVNPISMRAVERTPANILRGLFEVIPGASLISQALENHGIFEKAGAWATRQIQLGGDLGASIKKAIGDFLDSLSWTDIFNLGAVWERAKRIVMDPVNKLITFVGGLVDGFVLLIREAILRPLGAVAKGTPAWDLLCAVLGRDPVTGDPVPRSPEILIGGFMKLIGQEEIWENMKKANAIPRAFAWFQGALSGLVEFVSRIPSTFMEALRSLELVDIVLVPRAFVKVGRVFAGFLGRFLSWAGESMWKLLEIIFDVVSPGTWATVKKTGSALRSILRNPIPFMRNLVAAGMAGFRNFSANFLTHLKTGLLEWLTGSLPGVYIPKSFAIKEILLMVLSILGISWAGIRAKLVKIIGETAMSVLEKGFDIVVTLVRDGPAAAWEKIVEELGNLKDMVIGGITDLVVGLIVQKAIPKIISMFIPGAGFISAILAIYDTVMVFVEKISKIIQVVTAFVNSIVAIAQGNIAAAAAKVESVLAGLLGLAINFLMGFAGLGKIAEKVMGVIKKIQAKVDAAIDKALAWVVKMAKAFLAKAKAAVGNWWKKKVPVTSPSGEKHTLLFEGEGKSAKLTLRSEPMTYTKFLATLPPSGQVSQAQGLATQLDAAIAAASLENADPKAAKTVEDLLQNLAVATAPLLKGRMTSTPPVYGGKVEEFGTSTTVSRLIAPKTGSKPPATGGKIWDALNKRRDGNGSYYIKGHLLNMKLGGLGIWENLTPLTQPTNNRAQDSMEKKFEGPVKDLTVGTTTAVSFSSIAQYGRSHPLASEIPKFVKQNKKELAEIIAAERFVPVSVTCKAEVVDDKGKVLKSIGSFVIPNPIADREKDYVVTTATKSPFKLAGADPKVVQATLIGITATEASSIVAAAAKTKDVAEVGVLAGINRGRWRLATELPDKSVVCD